MTELVKNFWRPKAVVTAVIAVTFSIIYIAWTYNINFRDHEIAMAQHHMLMTANATARNIEEYIDECQRNIQTLANHILIQKGLREGNITPEIELAVKETYQTFGKNVNAIYILNSKGKLIHGEPPLDDKKGREMSFNDISGVSYVLKKHESHISRVFYTRSGELALSLLSPVNYDNEFVGIAQWLVKISTISKRFITPIEVGKNGYAQLLDDRGIILTHPKHELVGKHIITSRKKVFPEHDWSKLENIVEKMTRGEEGVGIYHAAWRTGKEKFKIEKKITAYAPIKIGNRLWSVGLSIGYSEITDPINKNSIYTFGFAGLLIILFCVGGFALYKSQKRKAVLEAIAESSEALRESEERTRSLLETIPNGVCECNIDGVITMVNTSLQKITGYDKDHIIGMQIWDMIEPGPPKDSMPEFFQQLVLEQPTPMPFEDRYITKDGSTIDVQVDWAYKQNQEGQVTGFVCVLADITEKRKIEAKLQHAQKMESIATLAGGIAHEFNNALMGIYGNIDLLCMDLPEDENINKYTEAMKVSAYRMADLANQLLAYARGGKYQPKTVSLSDFVKNTLPSIRHTIDPSIKVETDLPSDISNVYADFTQMQMVLSAVLTNSTESMGGKGCIRIATRDEGVAGEFLVKTDLALKPGHYVSLTIEDNGEGMDEETRNRIFDPFFTTKFQGRGLGMAAVYGIVKNHDGFVFVESELGKGTVVGILLPALEVKEKDIEKPTIGIVKGTGTILIIEDEEVVMDVNRAMLERLGYLVLGAKTGKEAIDIAKAFDGDIDLVMLDIVLPDMRGKRIYQLLMEARPNLKVLVCSGYSIDGPAQEIVDAGAEGFIQKPFSLEILSEKLKGLLE
jgi:PAS domain S-box-containing protein